MILVLWLARLLDLTSYYARRAADSIYRPYYRREARKSARAEMSRMMAQGRRDAAAAEDLIASTRPRRFDESPFNGETR